MEPIVLLQSIRRKRYRDVFFAVCLISALCYVFLPFANEKPKNSVELKIHGVITQKTLQEFKEALDSIEKSGKKLELNAVKLDSNGGSLYVAIEIGKLTRERHLNTYVAPDAACESACVYILIGGLHRYAFGKVGIHRSTYSNDVEDDSDMEEKILKGNVEISNHIRSMGISDRLDDAIRMTQSWCMRYLTETEKMHWQVFGTERAEEERIFNKMAKERFISRKEFIEIYKSHYDDCLNEVRDGIFTVYDCVHEKKSLKLSQLEKIGHSLYYWIMSLDDDKLRNSPFEDRVEKMKDDIHLGRIYLRYMSIENYDGDVKKIPEFNVSRDNVTKLEASNFWWVEDNSIYVKMKNPTDDVIHKILFSISMKNCNGSEDKSFLKMILNAPLESNRSSVYTAKLPFDYHNKFGVGTLCGVVESASNF